ncbi:breast cancer type 1 susceptibility protein brca1 [Anaeramoeba flamelloides]|uniref:Breast cancer type 1 susceptibility protein brca1 n=1 Tax=Anaeramoeba flamelloides TaxID=1746091 RepID=A0AAV7Z2C8_9EUKA|nr:breast cancer type 1 susceptibility protein brca1 [Anaeramoeba flamelloides]
MKYSLKLCNNNDDNFLNLNKKPNKNFQIFPIYQELISQNNNRNKGNSKVEFQIKIKENGKKRFNKCYLLFNNDNRNLLFLTNERVLFNINFKKIQLFLHQKKLKLIRFILLKGNNKIIILGVFPTIEKRNNFFETFQKKLSKLNKLLKKQPNQINYNDFNHLNYFYRINNNGEDDAVVIGSDIDSDGSEYTNYSGNDEGKNNNQNQNEIEYKNENQNKNENENKIDKKKKISDQNIKKNKNNGNKLLMKKNEKKSEFKQKKIPSVTSSNYSASVIETSEIGKDFDINFINPNTGLVTGSGFVRFIEKPKKIHVVNKNTKKMFQIEHRFEIFCNPKVPTIIKINYQNKIILFDIMKNEIKDAFLFELRKFKRFFFSLYPPTNQSQLNQQIISFNNSKTKKQNDQTIIFDIDYLNKEKNILSNGNIEFNITQNQLHFYRSNKLFLIKSINRNTKLLLNTTDSRQCTLIFNIEKNANFVNKINIINNTLNEKVKDDQSQGNNSSGNNSSGNNSSKEGVGEEKRKSNGGDDGDDNDSQDYIDDEKNKNNNVDDKNNMLHLRMVTPKNREKFYKLFKQLSQIQINLFPILIFDFKFEENNKTKFIEKKKAILTIENDGFKIQANLKEINFLKFIDIRIATSNVYPNILKFSQNDNIFWISTLNVYIRDYFIKIWKLKKIQFINNINKNEDQNDDDGKKKNKKKVMGDSGKRDKRNKKTKGVKGVKGVTRVEREDRGRRKKNKNKNNKNYKDTSSDSQGRGNDYNLTYSDNNGKGKNKNKWNSKRKVKNGIFLVRILDSSEKDFEKGIQATINCTYKNIQICTKDKIRNWTYQKTDVYSHHTNPKVLKIIRKNYSTVTFQFLKNRHRKQFVLIFTKLLKK